MLVDAAREELVRIFGADLARRIRRSTATAWSTDPWARGSYSAARPGFARCRPVLTRPLARRVFFAGEACVTDTFGAIHGAWASGVESARQVIETLTGNGAKKELSAATPRTGGSA
jgi:monoamine oxidase